MSALDFELCNRRARPFAAHDLIVLVRHQRRLQWKIKMPSKKCAGKDLPDNLSAITNKQASPARVT